MNRLIFVLCLSVATFAANAQKYISEKGVATFFSSATVEDITATNSSPSGIYDASTNQVAFSVTISDFKFRKKLMQEHFNEKYMESEKYPKSTFQGTLSQVDLSNKSVQQATAKGKFTIHGVTNEVEIPGTVEVTADGKMNFKSTFKVKLKDYQITIPQILWQNIAEEIEVKVEFTMKSKS